MQKFMQFSPFLFIGGRAAADAGRKFFRFRGAEGAEKYFFDKHRRIFRPFAFVISL